MSTISFRKLTADPTLLTMLLPYVALVTIFSEITPTFERRLDLGAIIGTNAVRVLCIQGHRNFRRVRSSGLTPLVEMSETATSSWCR